MGDKIKTTERFAVKNPSLHEYDEKFNFYCGLLKELNSMKDYHDVYCVRWAYKIINV